MKDLRENSLSFLERSLKEWEASMNGLLVGEAKMMLFHYAVQTLCGKLVNVEEKIYHVWHPPSNYRTNPNGKANAKLLQSL